MRIGESRDEVGRSRAQRAEADPGAPGEPSVEMGRRFEAAVGYDLGAIKEGTGPFTLEEELRWYSGPPEDFLRGIGRILKGEAVFDASFASSAERGPARLEVARVTEIKANILIPITDNDEIVAMLNIDSFSTETAFGPNSLRIAEAFAQHIAVIVRQAEQHGRAHRRRGGRQGTPSW